MWRSISASGECCDIDTITVPSCSSISDSRSSICSRYRSGFDRRCSERLLVYDHIWRVCRGFSHTTREPAEEGRTGELHGEFKGWQAPKNVNHGSIASKIDEKHADHEFLSKGNVEQQVAVNWRSALIRADIDKPIADRTCPPVDAYKAPMLAEDDYFDDLDVNELIAVRPQKPQDTRRMRP